MMMCHGGQVKRQNIYFKETFINVDAEKNFSLCHIWTLGIMLWLFKGYYIKLRL